MSPKIVKKRANFTQKTRLTGPLRVDVMGKSTRSTRPGLMRESVWGTGLVTADSEACFDLWPSGKRKLGGWRLLAAMD
jgi:hypothetical protein